MSVHAAVEALKKFIHENKIRAELNLESIWNLIVDAKEDELRSKGWIVNSTPKTVQIYVYNDSALLRWFPNQRVYAQADETVQVTTYSESDKCNMVVYKQGDPDKLSYNVKKNHLHVWTESPAEGPRMTMFESSMEDFRKDFSDQEQKKQELVKQEQLTKQQLVQQERLMKQELHVKELVKNELKEQKKQQEPRREELIGKMKKLGFDW